MPYTKPRRLQLRFRLHVPLMFFYIPAMDWTPPHRPHKGRAAVSSRTARYEALQRIAFDDGWDGDDEAAPPLRTVVGIDKARRIIATNKSPDVPFDQSINPYRGCEHGCIYCFARPTHAYYGLSPGLDFETKLFQKPDAPEFWRRNCGGRDTARRSSRSAPIPTPINRSNAV